MPIVLLPQAAKPDQIPTPPQKKRQETKAEQAQAKKIKTTQPQPPQLNSTLDPALIQLLTQAIDNISAEKHLEWVPLPHLGSRLKQLDAQFQVKIYRYKNLLTLIESQTDLFENRQQGMNPEVRLKQHTKKEKGNESDVWIVRGRVSL
jgi:hypothetical protein